MLFSQLTRVLLQLVSQGLDTGNILRLARCSQSNYAAACGALAWKHARSPIEVEFSIAHLSPSKLLRHAPLCIRWTHAIEVISQQPAPDAAEMEVLLRLTHITSIDARGRAKVPWQSILSSHSMRSLERLLLCAEEEFCLDDNSLRLLSALQHLHTLGACSSYYSSTGNPASALYPDGFFDRLLSLPSLSALELTDHGTASATELEPLCWINGIKRLQLRSPLREAERHRFFAQGNFGSTLEHLALEFIAPGLLQASLFAQPLRGLRRLHLPWLMQVASMLRHVEAAALEEVCLEAHMRLGESGDTLQRRDVETEQRDPRLLSRLLATREPLLHVLAAFPTLRIFLVLRSLDDCQSDDAFGQGCAALRSAFARPRVEVRSTLPPAFDF